MEIITQIFDLWIEDIINAEETLSIINSNPEISLKDVLCLSIAIQNYHLLRTFNIIKKKTACKEN